MMYRRFGTDNPAGDFEELESLLDREEEEERGVFTVTAHVEINKTFRHVTPEEAGELMADWLSQTLIDADFDCDGMEVS